MKSVIVEDRNTGMVWTVKLIEKGDAYGLEGRLIHRGPEAKVEFYDRGHADEMQAEEDGTGYFVTSYELATLVHCGTLSGRGPLCLDLSVPEWSITEPALREALAALTGKTIAMLSREVPHV